MRESAEPEAVQAFYAQLAQAEDDIRSGRVQDMDACLDELLEELDGRTHASPATHPRPAAQGLGSATLETEGFASAGRACKALQRRDCCKGEGGPRERWRG